MRRNGFLSALGLDPRWSHAPLDAAWSAWERGEIETAARLAHDAIDARSNNDAANHLLFLTRFVTGHYRDALDRYGEIGRSYRRRGELTPAVIDAHLHLGALGNAAAFARGRTDVTPVESRRLDEHLRRPFGVELTGVTAVSPADHPLAHYLPTFAASIDGHSLAVHLDTGGAFLHMGPARARSLGIKTIADEPGRAHLDLIETEAAYGIAQRFELGDAVMHNVPVDVLSTLTGANDVVVFGTNILEQFLSTVHYPARTLLLSRRGDAAAARAHGARIASTARTMPFYLWGDHFMFARGGFGTRDDLNFFVDSGLVSLHPDGHGRTRQASFTSSKRRLREMGFTRREMARGFFESSSALRLGPLREEHPMVVVGAAGDLNFGGVRIDGLISHAFLKRYVWTIDFDTREYRFGEGV
jgi:hypothetical protein